MDKRTKKQIEREEQIYQLTTLVAGEFSLQEVLDRLVDGRVKYKEATVKEGLVSQLTVAMNFRNKPIGVLRLYSPRPMHFDEEDINLARAVGSQCAVAITNARLYARAIEGARMAEQMRLAGIVQRRMIAEQVPTMPGLDIAAT